MDPLLSAYRARVGLFVGILIRILRRKAHVAANRIKGLRMNGLASMFSVFTLLLMLLMAGVEPNPGPGSISDNNGSNGSGKREQFDTLMSAVNGLARQITGLTDRVGGLETTNNDMGTTISRRLEAVELTLTTRVAQLEHVQNTIQLDVDAVDDKCSKLEEETEALKEQVASLDSKLVQMEAEARRKNLLFFGIPRAAGETWATCEETVHRLITRDMKLRGPFFIERARRIGAAVLVTFQSLRQRDQVLRRSRDLSAINSSMYIREDYPEKIRQRRAGLAPLLQQYRDDGKKASLRNDKLITENDIYTYDLDTQRYRRLSPRARPQNQNATSRQPRDHGINRRPADGSLGATAFNSSRGDGIGLQRHLRGGSRRGHQYRHRHHQNDSTQQSSGGTKPRDPPYLQNRGNDDRWPRHGNAARVIQAPSTSYASAVAKGPRGRGSGRGSRRDHGSSSGSSVADSSRGQSLMHFSHSQDYSPNHLPPDDGVFDDAIPLAAFVRSRNTVNNQGMTSIQTKLSRFAYSGSHGGETHHNNGSKLRGFGRGRPLSRSDSEESLGAEREAGAAAASFSRNRGAGAGSQASLNTDVTHNGTNDHY